MILRDKEDPLDTINVGVVDDSEVVRYMFKVILKRIPNVNCRLYSSGEELIISTEKHDLVFTDYNLDGMNGEEIVKNLMKFSPSTKVCYSTSAQLEPEKMEYYNVIGKLGKPMTIEDIFIVLEKFKNNRYAERPSTT